MTPEEVGRYAESLPQVKRKGTDSRPAWYLHDRLVVRLQDQSTLVIRVPLSKRESLLASYPDAFVQTLTEKLLMYGVGRTAHYYDMPAVRAIDREAATENNRFSAIVLGIVKSVPFRMRRAEAVATDRTD